MRKATPNSMISAAPGELPAFIRALVLAEILGVGRDCIYWRVNNGKLPPFDLDVGIAKGWLRETLEADQPVMMEAVKKFVASRVAK